MKQNNYINFIGHSADGVTGSCHLVCVADKQILLDCGMYQHPNPKKTYKINSKTHKDLNPKQIDMIILSHVHIDHCGMLPYLFDHGCSANIYVAKGSYELLKVMLLDSAKIMNNDHSVPNLYTDASVLNCLEHVIECEFLTPYKPFPNCTFTLYPAHHIVCSAQIYLCVKNGETIKKIGYTGDIGSSLYENPFLLPFYNLPSVDVLIGETTYGGDKRSHKMRDRKTDIDKITHCVQEIKENKGRLVFPVFSLNRLEDVLLLLQEVDCDKIPIIIDTPLGIKIYEQWENLINPNFVEEWKKISDKRNILLSSSQKESLAWMSMKGPIIILSSGGMLTAGRSVSWTLKSLGNSKHSILFTGFSTQNSLADLIRTRDIIKYKDKVFKKKCYVNCLNSLSSHMSKEELLKYYTEVQYNKICLVHGEMEGKIQFSKLLKSALKKKARTSTVHVVNYGTKIRF